MRYINGVPISITPLAHKFVSSFSYPTKRYLFACTRHGHVHGYVQFDWDGVASTVDPAAAERSVIYTRLYNQGVRCDCGEPIKLTISDLEPGALTEAEKYALRKLAEVSAKSAPSDEIIGVKMSEASLLDDQPVDPNKFSSPVGEITSFLRAKHAVNARVLRTTHRGTSYAWTLPENDPIVAYLETFRYRDDVGEMILIDKDILQRDPPVSVNSGTMFVMVDEQRTFIVRDGMWVEMPSTTQAEPGIAAAQAPAPEQEPKLHVTGGRVFSSSFYESAGTVILAWVAETGPSRSQSVRRSDPHYEFYAHIARLCEGGGSGQVLVGRRSEMENPRAIASWARSINLKRVAFVTSDTHETFDLDIARTSTPQHEQSTWVRSTVQIPSHQPQNTTTQTKDSSMTTHANPPKPLEILKTDATDAAWRTAGKQFIRLARDPLVAALSRNLAPGDDAVRAQIAAFLGTEAGEAMLTGMLSFALMMVPGGSEIPQRLARELRVSSMANAGDLVLEVVMEPLRKLIATGILGDAMTAATTAATGVRVEAVEAAPEDEDEAVAERRADNKTRRMTPDDAPF